MAAFDEFYRYELQQRLVDSGKIPSSIDIDEYEKNIGIRFTHEILDLEDEILSLRCFALCKQAHTVNYIVTAENISTFYAQYESILFSNGKDHFCEPMVCNHCHYSKNQPVNHPFTHRPLRYVSGDVFVCEKSGRVHICNEDDCDRKYIVSKGYDVCPISARSYQPDSIFLFKDKQFKNDCIDYEDPLSHLENAENENEGEVTLKTRNKSQYSHIVDSENDDDYDECKLNSNLLEEMQERGEIYFQARQEENQKRKRGRHDMHIIHIEDSIKRQREIIQEECVRKEKRNLKEISDAQKKRYTDYTLSAYKLCKKILIKNSPRNKALKTLSKSAKLAKAAFQNSLETHPFDLVRAECRHAEIFVDALSTVHASIFNSPISLDEIGYYTQRVISIWRMVNRTPYAKDKRNKKNIISDRFFAAALYLLRDGFNLICIIDSNTQIVLPEYTIYNMNPQTMESLCIPIIPCDPRLAHIVDCNTLRKKNPLFVDVISGIKTMKHCFNSLICSNTTIQFVRKFIIH